MIVAAIIFQLLFVLLLSPLCMGMIRTIKARMQNRHGASVFQPYRNLMKLFHKDEVISEDASWVFRFAPYIIFASTLLIASGIPITLATAFTPASDLLVFIYMGALGVFFLALAGIDPGSAFGGTGSSREMTLAAIAEGALFATLLVPALIAGSTNMGIIADTIRTLPFASAIPLGIAFVGFYIVLLSENARYPFDNPATHLELTMIHEAMILEYSGKRLALMEWAAANKLCIFLVLAANLFIPSLGAEKLVVLAAAVTAVKVLVLAAVIAVIESSIPKLRYFRLPDLLFTSFALALSALVISLML